MKVAIVFENIPQQGQMGIVDSVHDTRKGAATAARKHPFHRINPDPDDPYHAYITVEEHEVQHP